MKFSKLFGAFAAVSLLAASAFFVSCSDDSDKEIIYVQSPTEKKLEAGTYTIYHLQQRLDLRNNILSEDSYTAVYSNYNNVYTESDKFVKANATIDDLKKTYEGFTANSMSILAESEIYIYYNRNIITYTFNIGNKGKFEDGTTSKKVSGRYGTACKGLPRGVPTGNYYISKWKDSEENLVPGIFGLEDKTFTPVLKEMTANVGNAPEDFVTIPAGTFKMGSNVLNDSNKPVHNVTISKDFYMCDHEVTQAEYEAVMGTNPSKFITDAESGEVQENRPVEQVSWYDAIVYCNKLSLSEGLEPCYVLLGSKEPSDWGDVLTSSGGARKGVTCQFSANGYRLPTEAEWEYAARAGDDTVDALIYSGTNSIATLGDYAWYLANANSKTHEVKKKLANNFGLYDMSGNVHEWCWDWYYSKYYNGGDVTDPTGVTSDSYRVYRAGSWYDYVSYNSVSYRGYASPSYYDNKCGFRVVRSSSK